MRGKSQGKPQRKTQSQPKPRIRADLEEIRPRHFLVHNPMTHHMLRGEGTIEGKHFKLTSWRGEGLIARLRNNNFVVSTLEDQVQHLPQLPKPKPLGNLVRRLVKTIDRYSYFEPLALTWVPIEPEQGREPREVLLHIGWVVRRRFGRGAATFHLVFGERGGTAGLAPLSETEALLAGYAQATQHRHPPLLIHRQQKATIFPDIELPPPHRALLERLGELREFGWEIESQAEHLAYRIYERLGLPLAIHDERLETGRR